MTTKFKEFIAPFPQKETKRIETPTCNPPGVYFPDPETKRDEGRITSMQVDFSGIYSSRNKFNIIKNHELYRYTRNYICDMHEHYFSNNDTRGEEENNIDAFTNKLNPKNKKNAQKQMNQWKNLEGLIPKQYFEVINIDPKVLECMLEADAEDYMWALNSKPEINCYIVRYMSGMYKGLEMPATNDEQYAINYIRAYQLKMPFRCCINILDIKSIYLELDSTVLHYYYYPEFRIEGDYFRFTGSNKNNGMVLGIGEEKEFGLSLFE
ncbi:MAG: hypothetical protein IH597_01635 [Bacteroidales bacterium]|nr:hypothetical protein [Bacteroidales bacterium]